MRARRLRPLPAGPRRLCSCRWLRCQRLDGAAGLGRLVRRRLPIATGRGASRPPRHLGRKVHAALRMAKTASGLGPDRDGFAFSTCTFSPWSGFSAGGQDATVRRQIQKTEGETRLPVMSGKRAFLDLLKQEGVEILFGNPGTTELPLMDAFAVENEIRYILGLQ